MEKVVRLCHRNQIRVGYPAVVVGHDVVPGGASQYEVPHEHDGDEACGEGKVRGDAPHRSCAASIPGRDGFKTAPEAFKVAFWNVKRCLSDVVEYVLTLIHNLLFDR